MSEREKALSGVLYNANDEELIKNNNHAKKLLMEYNHLCIEEKERKNIIISELLGAIGENFKIEPPFYCGYGYNTYIGKNFYANVNVVILDPAEVRIGDNVFLAPNVGIYTAGHPFDVIKRNSGLEYAYPVNIGNNVWIGANSVILPGVSIGDNCVIGAGSVVTGNIPPGVLAFGNPARTVKNIV